MGRIVDRVPAPLRAPVGSLLVTARRRELCLARPTVDGWVHRYRDGVTVHPRLGGESARLQDHQTRDTFLYGYEPAPGDIVFDIGAGVGGEVRLLSRLVGPSGRVVSVEAHPRTYTFLRRTIELNGLSNVTSLPVAVAGVSGTVYLDDDSDNHIANGLAERGAGMAVPGWTLAELMDRVGTDRIDLLKMNIEGAELAALRSARDHLHRVRHVVISCHDFKAETTGAAWQRTFAPVRDLLTGAGFVLRSRPDDHRPWIRYYLYGHR